MIVEGRVVRAVAVLSLLVAGCHAGPHPSDAAVPVGDGGADLAVQLEDLAMQPGDLSTVDASRDLAGGTLLAYAWPDFGPIFAPLNGVAGNNAVPFTPEGCNTVAYGTTPELGTWMVGRVFNGDVDPIPGQCPKNDMGKPVALAEIASLSWVQMNWSTATVTFDHRILDTGPGSVPIEGGASSISSAYDPTVADFSGEHWVSFECVAAVVGTSACVGPLWIDPDKHTVMVDTVRTSVVVRGVPTTPLSHAATVPKLVVFGGNLYVYWGDLTSNADHSAGNAAMNAFVSVDTRGVQLAQDPVTGRMYPSSTFGAHAPSAIDSNDPTSTLVMPNVDWKQIIDANGNLIVTGDLAQASSMIDDVCITPLDDQIPNCWRLFFAQSQSPLVPYGMPGGFTLVPSEANAPTQGLSTVVTSDGIPADPGTYNRFVYRAGTAHNTELMGGSFFTKLPGSQAQQSYTFAWPDDLFTAPVLCSPYPSSIVFDGTCLPAGPSSIEAGDLVLAAGACVSASGAKLCMQTTGNLVAFDSSSHELWGTEMLQSFDVTPNSGPNATLASCPGCVAKFQSDGNLVLLDGSNVAYWASKTGAGTGTGEGASLHLSGTSPYVSVQNASGQPVFDRFPGGFRLYATECVTLGTAELCMKTAGNLVLTDNGTERWDSTSFTSNDVAPYSGTTADIPSCTGCYASFDTNGRLTLFNPDPKSGGTYWATTGAAGPGAMLELATVSNAMPHVGIVTSAGALFTPSGW